MNSISTKNFGVKSLNGKAVEQSKLIEDLRLKLQTSAEESETKVLSIMSKIETLESRLSLLDERITEIES